MGRTKMRKNEATKKIFQAQIVLLTATFFGSEARVYSALRDSTSGLIYSEAKSVVFQVTCKETSFLHSHGI